MRTLILALLLAVPGRAGQPLPPVESPTGKPFVESPDDRASLERRARWCDGFEERARRFKSESAVSDMLPCLSHPDPWVRSGAISAMDRDAYFQRPDFEKNILPLLRQAVAAGSADPDANVRQSAGSLSRAIEQWEATESPAAKARGVQFRKDERRRFLRNCLRPDREGWLTLVLLSAVVLAVWVLPKSGRRLP